MAGPPCVGAVYAPVWVTATRISATETATKAIFESRLRYVLPCWLHRTSARQFRWLQSVATTARTMGDCTRSWNLKASGMDALPECRSIRDKCYFLHQ